jgi:hypothetical protein
MVQDGRGSQPEPRTAVGNLHGIVVNDGRRPDPSASAPVPRIAAFIWGGKVRPSPTLPYGRWKGAA